MFSILKIIDILNNPGVSDDGIDHKEITNLEIKSNLSRIAPVSPCITVIIN